MSNADLIRENRDIIETVANADLPASWIAEELLSSIDEYPSEDSEEQQTGVQANSKPNTDTSEVKDSLFAY